MIQTNIKKIFEEAGLEAIRPTDQALETMGISRRRFTLLLENTHVSPISVQELESIKEWIQGIQTMDTDRLIGEYSPTDEVASSLGLSK